MFSYSVHPAKKLRNVGQCYKKECHYMLQIYSLYIFGVGLGWGVGGGWSSGDNADQSVVFNGLRHLLKSPLLAWRLHIGATGRSQVLEFHPYETSGKDKSVPAPPVTWTWITCVTMPCLYIVRCLKK